MQQAPFVISVADPSFTCTSHQHICSCPAFSYFQDTRHGRGEREREMFHVSSVPRCCVHPKPEAVPS